MEPVIDTFFIIRTVERDTSIKLNLEQNKVDYLKLNIRILRNDLIHKTDQNNH